MKNISIDSYSFHGLLREGKMDIFHYLESLKYRYRVDAAGIWNGFFASTDEDYIRKVKEALDEKGMTVPNIAVDGASVWADSEDVREKNRQNALRHLEAARILGAKSVRIDWGVTTPEITDEQFDFIAKRYREYCRIASDYGFVVGPENHFGASLNPYLMKKMIEAVNDPAYKILLHIGRWKGDDADKGDVMMAPYTMHTHVSIDMADAGLEEKLKSIIDAGYQGFWGIEFGSGKDEFVQVEWLTVSVKRALELLSK